MRRIAVVLAVAAVVVAGVAGCATGSGAASGSAAAGAGYTGDRLVVYANGVRPAAPPIAGALLDGAAFDAGSVRGQVLVVNFWGSWCAPCRAESHDLQSTYAQTAGLGVRFLGIDVRDGHDAATSFITDFAVTYPSIFDPGGRVALGFRDVPPAAIPATVILDRRGRIAAVYRGRITAKELGVRVTALAAEER